MLASAWKICKLFIQQACEQRSFVLVVPYFSFFVLFLLWWSESLGTENTLCMVPWEATCMVSFVFHWVLHVCFPWETIRQVNIVGSLGLFFLLFSSSVGPFVLLLSLFLALSFTSFTVSDFCLKKCMIEMHLSLIHIWCLILFFAFPKSRN